MGSQVLVERRESGRRIATWLLRRLDPGDLRQGCDEPCPILALTRQHPPAAVGNPIASAAALPRPLDPSPADPAALLEAVERFVERRQREAQRAPRSRLDPARNFVAVERLLLDERENQQVGAALFRGVDGGVLLAARHI